MDEKQKKFERLAEKRVTEAVKRIRLIANLSNRNNYSYTSDHVNQIINELEREINALKNKFNEPHNSNKEYKFMFNNKTKRG